MQPVQLDSSTPPRFIVLAGAIGAGKSTAARHLCACFDVEHASFVDSIWLPILRERGVQPTRAALQDLGIELRESLGFLWIVDHLVDALDPDRVFVIDDVRAPEVYQLLLDREAASKLIFIQTSLDSRFPRLVIRDGLASMEDQVQAEKVSTETEIANLKPIADYVVENNGDLSVFESRLSGIAESLGLVRR